MKYINVYKMHFLNKNFDSKMFFNWQSLKNKKIISNFKYTFKI